MSCQANASTPLASIQETELPSASQSDPSPASLQQNVDTAIPLTISMTMTSDSGAYTVKIFANITYQKAADYPVLRLNPDPFTQDQADKFLTYFLGKAKLYKPEAANSKDKQYISSKFNKVQISGVETQQILANADVGNGAQASVDIENKLDDAGNCSEAKADIFANIGNNVLLNGKLTGQAQGISMKPEDASSNAQGVLKNLGIGDVAVTNVQTGLLQGNSAKQGYVVEADRVVNGIPITVGYIPTEGESQSGEITVYRPDEIMIALDGTSITRFSWYDKCKIVGTVSQNSRLQDFGKIMAAAEDQIKNKFSWLDEDMYKSKNAKMEIDIGQISLEYKCIPERGDPENLKLIPVWNFYGSSTYQDSDGTNPNFYGPPNAFSYLCVNALDGTVIKSNNYID
jgi:hypothetical protein